MTTGTFPDAWEEVVLITIQKLGGTAYHYAAILDTLDLPQGDYPGESMPNLAGGRRWKQSPQEDGEITLEFWGIALDPTASQGLFQEFEMASGYTVSSSAPHTNDTSWPAGTARTRSRFLVAIMWTDDIAQTSAVAATTTTDSVAVQFAAKECRLVSHKASFTDRVLKMTLTFKYPAMNPAGTLKCYRWASTNAGGTAQTPLVAITYTADPMAWP